MILDFYYYNPTKVYFGKTALSHLSEELKNYGDNILFLYGEGSIKKIVVYDQVSEVLKNSGKNIIELSGIKPNPTYKQMMECAKFARENNIDLILAVGGGSVIDCAKAISVSAHCKGDPWQRYWVNKEDVDNEIIPVGCIPTLSGTGSEMNGGSVITNEDEMIKCGRVFPPEVNPKFSILNPNYTFGVPKLQMVSGIFDAMSHLMEQYFTGFDDNTTDYIIEGVFQSLRHSTEIALRNPRNYEIKSNIMWCSTMALNQITGLSKRQDWQVHMIEHQLSAYTNCAHGVGLAVLSVPYYKHIYKFGWDKFARFAKKMWDVDTDSMPKYEAALMGIEKLDEFIKKMELPTRLRDIGATEEMLPKIANSTEVGGGYKKMTKQEILTILQEAY